jgi:hypothetical protein
MALSQWVAVQVVPDACWCRSSVGPVNMATNVRDTRSASETWTIMNSTMPVVQRKRTRHAFSKLPNGARSSENWIGFQMASPKEHHDVKRCSPTNRH